jgi:hypothetical protein
MGKEGDEGRAHTLYWRSMHVPRGGCRDHRYRRLDADRQIAADIRCRLRGSPNPPSPQASPLSSLHDFDRQTHDGTGLLCHADSVGDRRNRAVSWLCRDGEARGDGAPPLPANVELHLRNRSCSCCMLDDTFAIHTPNDKQTYDGSIALSDVLHLLARDGIS